jgi:hypothetical protein
MTTAMSKKKPDNTEPKLTLSQTCRAEDEGATWESKIEILLHTQYNDFYTQSKSGRAICGSDNLVGRNLGLARVALDGESATCSAMQGSIFSPSASA